MKECEKCKSKLVLVSGTFYFNADPEPYENGVEEEVIINADLWVNAYYCPECDELPEIWEG